MHESPEQVPRMDCSRDGKHLLTTPGKKITPTAIRLFSSALDQTTEGGLRRSGYIDELVGTPPFQENHSVFQKSQHDSRHAIGNLSSKSAPSLSMMPMPLQRSNNLKDMQQKRMSAFTQRQKDNHNNAPNLSSPGISGEKR